MKALLRRIAGFAAGNDCSWSLLDATLLRAARRLSWERLTIERAKGKPVPPPPLVTEAIQKLMPDLIVRHGPFKGMKYPAAAAVGSTLFPKLIGSYEREIHPVIETICTRGYSEIIDIGCAEGYYAVGLAMRIPTARVFAYDTKPAALELCNQMAQLNNVGDRVTTGGFCDAATLASFPFTRRGLIISDCEGYEKKLFTDELVPHLAQHDLLIEMHDFADIETSGLIRRRFEKSHDIQTVQSVDDIKKAQTYDYNELRGYGLAARKILLGETRPTIMEWFFLTPRATDANA